MPLQLGQSWQIDFYRILGSHSGVYEKYYLLEYNAM
jgi:hypothetical protein